MERGPIVAAVAATGTLNAVTTVQVGTQVSGTIYRLLADFNSPVKAGQVIAEIDPALFQAQLEQAEGNHLSARANLEKARVATRDAARNLERFRDLLARGFVSRSEFDAAETAHLSAQAGEKAAEAAVVQTRGSLQQARTNLQHATIRSPVDGVVINRNIDVGQTVAASFQTPTLFTIAEDLTRMQIDTSVDEADIGRVRVGLPATFTVDAWAGEIFRGEVAQIRYAPVVNQNVVTYNVVVTVDNPEKKLFPGMTANVAIEIERRDDALRLPAAALRYHPKPAGEAVAAAPPRRKAPQSQVYLPGPEGRPVAVPVRTGIGDGSHIELLEGNLREGDQVITGQVEPRNSPRFLQGTAVLMVVQLFDIRREYALGEQRVKALDGISFAIARGEFVAIMGSSGSGKSTCMNILGCLDRPTGGRYLLDGIEVESLDGDALAGIRNRKIGFIFQGFNLLARTSALENVALPLIYARVPGSQRTARAMQALTRVGLEQRAHHTSAQLSGGQQQRVAIARAMANEPALILADEPTGNLDSATSEEIMQLFGELHAGGITIVMVTHEADVAAHAGRIITFRDGRILADRREEEAGR